MPKQHVFIKLETLFIGDTKEVQPADSVSGDPLSYGRIAFIEFAAVFEPIFHLGDNVVLAFVTSRSFNARARRIFPSFGMAVLFFLLPIVFVFR